MTKSAICLILYTLIHSSIFAQQQISEIEIAQFNKTLIKEVLEEIDKNKRIYSSLPSKFEVITVPNCNIELATVSERVLNGKTPQFKIDKSSGFILMKDFQGNILRVAYKNGFISFSPDKDVSSAEMTDIKMIELVYTKYSKHLFFVSLSELTPDHVIGFLKGDSIQFIDNEMRIINDFKKIANKENGSLQKYIENMELKHLKSMAIKEISSLEGATQVLRRDYISYSEAFPNDTTKVLNILLDEIALCCQVTNDQRVLIKEQIVIKMKRHLLFPFNQSSVWFYGFDIAPCIKSILTKNQYCNFLEKRELNSWLGSQASNKVYHYLNNEKKIPEDSISEEFKRIVFR